VARQLPKELYSTLACPCCKDKPPLKFLASDFGCPVCGTCHPVIGGVPILINPAASLFDPKDYLDGPEPAPIDSRGTATKAVVRAIRKITPKLVDNLNGGENVAFLLSQLTGIRKPSKRYGGWSRLALPFRIV
jgi:uncharacterized protein YbaR (Trm112 family)